MNDLELRREKIERIAKWAAYIGVLGALGFVVAPIVFTVIQGLLGLIAMIAIATITVNLIPWFSTMVANWRLKALKYEASRNPIETLENEYNRRRNALIEYRQAIKNFKAETASFSDQLEDFKAKFPKDAGKFDSDLQKMIELLKFRFAKYQAAKADLEKFASEIDRAKAFWKMAEAAAKMNKAAGVDTDAFYARIKTETAIESVQSSMNNAFADLELSLAEEAADAKARPIQIQTETPKAIEVGGDANTIELEIEIPEPRKKQS